MCALITSTPELEWKFGVIGSHNLFPKDGQGTRNAFVELELYFDRQKHRTTIKDRDLNQVWNESFFFNISDPSRLHYVTHEAQAYSHKRPTNGRSLLGKVSLPGTSFVPHSDAIVLHFPMEKRGIFSRVRAELGLKVYITDEASLKSYAAATTHPDNLDPAQPTSTY
ncbi:hypothetical protein F2Q69_00027214 [Brassica cretica]|uniref:C2 domain-containing protein n=1 Tax=Brassica cretica TaxID=69181 RepID=A0A8S9RRT8_BRACR|nr:hypothetical protein F2Q69_00027214 [Brassica cretica]